MCDLSYTVDWRGNAVTDALGTAREIYAQMLCNTIEMTFIFIGVMVALGTL